MNARRVSETGREETRTEETRTDGNDPNEQGTASCSAVPDGTVSLADVFPGLRPGLFSAVPSGLGHAEPGTGRETHFK
jgi:hypothetical protein